MVLPNTEAFAKRQPISGAQMRRTALKESVGQTCCTCQSQIRETGDLEVADKVATMLRKNEGKIRKLVNDYRAKKMMPQLDFSDPMTD